jgi:two-component system chemotaxis sensor kinase CheA
MTGPRREEAPELRTNTRIHMSDDDDLDDLSQFYGVFFEEADEHLAAMESLLLGVDMAQPDPEQLNAIFRAAHSIKGGAAVFDFSDITSLTHEMETTFDKVRKSELALSPDLIDAFLASGDALRAMFSVRKGQGEPPPAEEVEALIVKLKSFLAPKAVAPVAPVVAAAPAPVAAPEVAAAKPKKSRAKAAKASEAPAVPAAPITAPIAAEAPVVQPEPEAVVTVPAATTAPTEVPAPAKEEKETYGFFVDPATLPAAKAAQAEAAAKAPALKVVPKQAAHVEENSIRVSTQKVDQLINLVGELVISQAMLEQAASRGLGPEIEGLMNAVSQLQRNTRDVQEVAMSMRMMQMSSVFSRFPRMVRDVSAKLGKEVEFVTTGEGTELDKGLIERISDPLTHLVRNSLDHGIETPDEREAKGKMRKALITMRAFHQGGAIVIEVSDDGRGLNRKKILEKAAQRGMQVSDSMADQEVWQLIFEAGFSTADKVTDVSGRGVGMDVVRRNIQEMGGRVEIDSTLDIGTRIRIKLPLTLAILDGMSVRYGRELFIIPLNYISESLQPNEKTVSTVGGRGEVMCTRGEYVPVVSLGDVLGMRSEIPPHEGVIVIVESEGGKMALRVDGLVGQHQVVIKSLETNYRKVVGVSGATIMGDGRVAMILDVPFIVETANRPAEKAAA